MAVLAACSGPDTPLSIARIEPTVFYKRAGAAEELQVARIAVTNRAGARDVTVEARLDGRSFAGPAHIPAGGLEDLEVLVPPLGAGAVGRLEVRLVDGGDVLARREEDWRHQRKWKVFLAPYCHIDVGFTNAQDDVEAIHELNLDGQVDADGNLVGVLDLIDATDDFPDDAKFRFTSEGSWPVVRFLDDPAIPQARKDTLLRRIREGRIEVGGFYIDHVNKFMGDEALVRSTYFAAEHLARAHGIEVSSAILNDVTDASSVVQVLANAGIRYFQFGPNSVQYPLPALFTMRAPRTDARVLVWRTPNSYGYAENADLYLKPRGAAGGADPLDPGTPVVPALYQAALEEHLQWLQDWGLPLPRVVDGYRDADRWRVDYPHDAYFVPYYPAHAGDNGHQDLTPSLLARDWNQRYAYPRLIVATEREFFRYAERELAGRIPEIPIDLTGYFGEQVFLAAAQIDPIKETKNREFVELMAEGEAFAAFALAQDPAFPHPAPAAIRDAWGRNILNNDHNPIPVPVSGNQCPATSSGRCYDAEDVLRWKQTRARWVDETHGFARDLVAAAQAAIAGRIADPVASLLVVVFNPSAWQRFDAVEVDLPAALAPLHLEDDGGAEIPHQVVAAGAGSLRVAFLATVPAFGYRAYRVRGGDPAPAPPLPTDTAGADVVIENEFFVVRVPKRGDAAPGAIASLLDKETGRELVDPAAPDGFNQYSVLLRSEAFGGGILGDDGLQELRPGWVTSTAELLEAGPVRARIRVTGEYDPTLRTPALVEQVAGLAGERLGIAFTPPPTSPTDVAQDILLYRDVKRVELVQTFFDTPPQTLENAFAYPLNLPAWDEIRVELPYNPIRAGGMDWAGLWNLGPRQQGDEAMAVRLEWKGLNEWNLVFLWIEGMAPDVVFRHFIDVSGPDFGVAFSSRDSGLVLPAAADVMPFPAAPAPRFHHLAVGPTALGELILGAPVNATYTFRSALVSHAGPWTTTDGVAGHGTVARWARAYTAPLSAVVTAPAATGTSPASRSFASVDEPNVVMPVIKRAEDGDGYVVRLLETVGTRTAAHARLSFAGPSVTVSVSTTVERDVCLIGARPADGFEVAIEPHELLTLRVRTGAAPAPAGVPACPGKGRP